MLMTAALQLAKGARIGDDYCSWSIWFVVYSIRESIRNKVGKTICVGNLEVRSHEIVAAVHTLISRLKNWYIVPRSDNASSKLFQLPAVWCWWSHECSVAKMGMHATSFMDIPSYGLLEVGLYVTGSHAFLIRTVQITPETMRNIAGFSKNKTSMLIA